MEGLDVRLTPELENSTGNSAHIIYFSGALKDQVNVLNKIIISQLRLTM